MEGGDSILRVSRGSRSVGGERQPLARRQLAGRSFLCGIDRLGFSFGLRKRDVLRPLRPSSSCRSTAAVRQ
jgi:hypothetical protein